MLPMKKLISLLLALTMLLGAAYAFAEEEEAEPVWEWKDLYDDDGNYIGYETYVDGELISYTTYEKADDGLTSTETTYDAKGTKTNSYVNEYDEDGNYVQGTGYNGYNEITSASKHEYSDDSWTVANSYFDNGEVVYANIWGSDEGEYYDVYFEDGAVISAYSNNGEEYLEYDAATGKWLNSDTGEEAEAPDLDMGSLLVKAKSMTSRKATYNNNTVSLGGISLRDVFPGLTSKWYGVVPVDLSKDGTQSFPLVASGLYIVGKVNVTVAGDEVTAELEYAASEESIKPQGECLAWFTSADQITGDFLDNPTSDMAFGKAISKSKDLDGKDVALLFVCNQVSYSVPFTNEKGPARFVRSSGAVKDYLSGLNDLMAKMK